MRNMSPCAAGRVKGNAMPLETKEAMLKQIEELNQQLEELQNQLSARDAMLSQTGEEGYLVTTPNPNYTGFTAKVEFKNGRAFVPMSVSNVELVVQRLVNDFGYSARKMTSKDFQELAQPVAEKKPLGMEALLR